MKKKKIVSVLLIALTLFEVFAFAIPTIVNAASSGTLSHPKVPDVWYTRRGGGKPYMSAQYETYSMDGKVVYCIEPGIDITTTRYLGYDDGIYGILRIIELLSKTDKKISELFEGMNHYFSTEEIKIRVRDDNKFKIVDEVIDYAKDKNYNFSLVDGIRVMFDDGWALVRASNTGPDLTVRFEAKTERRLKEIQDEFTLVIDKVK